MRAGWLESLLCNAVFGGNQRCLRSYKSFTGWMDTSARVGNNIDIAVVRQLIYTER